MLKQFSNPELNPMLNFGRLMYFGLDIPTLSCSFLSVHFSLVFHKHCCKACLSGSYT